ncbi:efflux RND transporter periplasmic adaptor subunit [Aquabacterium sp.]|uniref:efflux RND transporter periplasmic adaptor subunit n=1 Tax=Aquabacterium sp. TaxID=1872578 RepID=UPI002C171F20|nr:HlyD family efflux transporter periplasmic adaptor subunit [Aquabacterium sp.]HSW04247.1 HlyD family efflux transporter periplasmic adaptor subunit [Aquabacterium sp.]
MDRALAPPPRWQRLVLPAAVATAALVAVAAAAWQRPPQLQRLDSAQLAPVRAGEFRDDLALRARVEPLHSVQLDAAEAGRVEAVLAHDGDRVAAGAPLYRLHSPEQEQLLMQRSAEVAQQMANVSVQRSALAASLAQNRRELALLQAAEQQAVADYQRQARLAASGFVADAALEQAGRQQQLAAQLLQQAEADQRLEADTRRQSLAEMARAVQGLQRGLQLLERARQRLQPRAPIAGQLSGFQLQVGTSVRPGDRLGRIDDPASGVQLVADVDEYYLPRLQVGQIAVAADGAHANPAIHPAGGTLILAQTLPQVQGGKVRVLLRWTENLGPAEPAPAEASGGAPASASAAVTRLRPGQAVELRLRLSAPTAALLLPDGPGVQTQLYVRQGRELQRRTVQLGRRAAGQVEVLAGLRAGDEVLISQPPTDAERLALP